MSKHPDSASRDQTMTDPNSARSRRSSLVPHPSSLFCILLLFVLPLALFWQVTLGSRTLLPADNLYQSQPWAAYRQQVGAPAVPHNALLSDLVLENLPWKQFIRDSFANGELPLWNPYIFAGVPFLAAGQHSALYPFSIIYYVLPLEKAYGWFTVSQLWLAGLWMFLFMRGLGLRNFGALLAGVAYQLSGFFLASVVFQMIIAAAAWLPFLLLMVEFTLRRRPLFGRPAVIPWVVLGAVGLGMEILAGHVEFTYYALLIMGFWAACRLGMALLSQRAFADFRGLPHPRPPHETQFHGDPARPLPVNGEGSHAASASPSLPAAGTAQRSWPGGEVGFSARLRYLLRPAVALISMVVLGMGVGAVQFVPTLELANANFREGRSTFEEVRGYALPARHALTWLMPNFYGSPAQHEYFDVFSGQTTPLNWQRPDGQTVTDTNWEIGKNYVEGACYVGLLTLFLAGIALLNGLFERSPGTRIVSAGPYRAIFCILSVMSVLFAFGTIFYGILYYGLPGFSQLHSPFRWIFPLTLCLAALAGFGAEALQRARSEPGSFTARLARWLGLGLVLAGVLVLIGLFGSRAAFQQLHAVIGSAYQRLAGANLAFPNVEVFYSHIFREALIFALILIGCGIVLRASRWKAALPRRLGRVPIWEALSVALLALDLGLATGGFNPAADPAWLQFEPPAITWLKAQNPQEWRFTAVEGPTHTLNANAGWLYGLQDVRGYDSMIPKQYADYMRQIQPQDQLLYNRIAPLFPDKLDALKSPWLDKLGVRYVVSEIDLDTTKYPAYRRVYRDEAVKIYENSEALPRAYVVPDCGAPPQGPVQAARISESRFVQMTVETSTGPGKTCLVLADSYFPGWRAYIRPQGTPEDQEREIPVELVYGNFRGVMLELGAWTVRFRYSPPAFQVGAFASFMSGAVLVFLLLTWGWRTFYTEGQGEAGSARRLAKNSLAPIVLNLFNRLIDFAFAAIMLRLLGPANAGVYYYAIVIFGWFDTLTNFGLNLLLTREVARDRSQAGRYLLNSSVLRLILAGIGVPFLVGFLLVRQGVAEPLDVTAILVIVLLYVGLVPNSISYGLTALFYAFEKAELPAAISTVTAILKALFGLAVLLAGWGVIGLAAVSIALNVITLAILSALARGALAESRRGGSQTRPYSGSRIDRGLMREMVGAGWPLMLNNLLAGMFYKIDVTLLEPLQGKAVVGAYSTAYKWLDALGIIPSLFTMALLPLMSRQAREDRAGLQRSYQFAVKLLVCMALPVAVVTTFLAPFLIGLLGGARFLPDGAIALQLMVWFFPIGWINSLTNYVLIALDMQKPMRWAFLAGVGFNVVANLIFIPLYSYRAAAVITIFSEVVLLVGFYLLLRRALGPVRWLALLWKPWAAALLMFGAMALLWPTLPFLALVAGAAAYLLALLILRPFDSWELGRVAPLLPARLRARVIPAGS